MEVTRHSAQGEGEARDHDERSRSADLRAFAVRHRLHAGPSHLGQRTFRDFGSRQIAGKQCQETSSEKRARDSYLHSLV